MGMGSRVGGWGQPRAYPGLTACGESSRLAVVLFPSLGGRHFFGHWGEGCVLRLSAGDRGRSGSTVRAMWNAPRFDRG